MEQFFEEEIKQSNNVEIQINIKGIDPNRLLGTLIAAQDTQIHTFTTKPMICLNDQGGNSMDITSTLRASMGGNLPIVTDSQQGNKENSENLCPTTTGTSANNQSVLFHNHAKDCRYNGPLKVAPTVAAAYGSGGNNVPLLAKPIAYSLDSKNSNYMKSDNPNSGCRETDKVRTIDTATPNPSKNQGGIAIVQESFCIASNTINRQDKNSGNGQGIQKDISYTLTTRDVHAIFNYKPYQEIVGALCHRDYKGVNSIYVNQDKCIVDRAYQNVIGTLCTRDYKGTSSQYVNQNKCIVDNSTTVIGQSSFTDFDTGNSILQSSGDTNGGGSENLAITQNLVRRLTPLECERLQGFPNGWTDIPKASDSSRYKALGNSVAVPCVDFVLRGIAFFTKI